MEHTELNKQFTSYAETLYAAAKRMLDKRNPMYEDKVQDLVILAYEEFKRKAEQGTIMNLLLLIHFMKLRKPEVQLEMRGDSRTHKKDVFNKRNYYEGKYELYSIDNTINDESGETFAESIPDEHNHEEEIIFHLDYQTTLASMQKVEETVVQMRLHGFENYEIAQSLNVHSSTIQQTLDHLSETVSHQKKVQCELQF
jgi:DNA-directed RNA polymerase specialized sigma24 family protein